MSDAETKPSSRTVARWSGRVPAAGPWRERSKNLSPPTLLSLRKSPMP